ncbi:unnamed protein product, partial [marine sediment metagenome]
YAFDNDPNIMVQEHSRDRVVEPGNNALIVVEVRALEEPVDPEAHLQIRGHFSSGKHCYESMLSKSFNVTVLPLERESRNDEVDEFAGVDCSKFSMSVPAVKEIENGKGVVEFYISNFSGARANISFEGSSVQVQPSLLSVPANTANRSYATVETENTGDLYYRVSIANCAFQPEKTRIVNVQTITPAEPGETGPADDTNAAHAGEGEEEESLLPGIGSALFGLGASYGGILLLLVLIVVAILILSREGPEPYEAWIE